MNETEYNIVSQEVVTRYIFSKSHYSAENRRVKYGAIMPKGDRASVYRTTNLNPSDIWDIGQRFVADPSQRTLYARGDILESDVLEVDLTIEPDTQIHLLHANIIGWPDYKAEKILIAKKLADKASLHEKP